MFIVCYLAQDDRYTSALRERLALAKQPKALLLARSVPELISLTQTLPIKAVVADIGWPRAIWTQIDSALQGSSARPLLALSPSSTDEEWWRFAHDLLRLDEHPDLFLYRIERSDSSAGSDQTSMRDAAEPPSPHYQAVVPAMPAVSTALSGSVSGLLENSQFRQFAGVFSSQDESTMVDSFVGWVQQACLTSRVVLLLRNPETGDFECQAQRGLPSTLVPHCKLPSTAPLCLWLTTTGHILIRDPNTGYVPRDVLNGLDLMQAAVAVPTMSDGQLIGILGIGPRLVGHGYSAMELEGLFTLGGQIALTLQHLRLHRTIQAHQDMTEKMLKVIPTGIIVLGADHRIAFVNPAAAHLMQTEPSSLHGMDLRALPSPLGDTAYEALVMHANIPRQELQLSPTGHPVAITCANLGTTPSNAMLLMEDLSAHKQLEHEHGRRIDLEVITNLVHYLAHELRNPLVALSTFNNLVSSHATDTDFQDFCDSVLKGEIERVNLLLEQLLVLTNHAEFQFGLVALGELFERLTDSMEMRSRVVTAVPVTVPVLRGDAHQLETAMACMLRTALRLSREQTPVTLQVTLPGNVISVQVEAIVTDGISVDWLLNPWEQLVGQHQQDVDFGLATAQYIIEQHQGSLTTTIDDNTLIILCLLPIDSRGGDAEVTQNALPRSSARR